MGAGVGGSACLPARVAPLPRFLPLWANSACESVAPLAACLSTKAMLITWGGGAVPVSASPRSRAELPSLPLLPMFFPCSLGTCPGGLPRYLSTPGVVLCTAATHAAPPPTRLINYI